MKIGILDSGIGGLTVLHQALYTLPTEEFIYYADTDHVPYGTKSREEVIGFVDMAVNFLVQKGVKAIVIACNTATSIAAEYVRAKYNLPILGMEPAIKPAVRKSQGKRVMVIATPLTVKEDKLQNLLQQVDNDHRVDLLPLPGLVVFAEKGEFASSEVEAYLRKELSEYQLEDYSAFILGCTHFNYFKDTLHKILPDQVEFIDGTQGTINHLHNILKERDLLEQHASAVEYYTSGRLVTDDNLLKHFAKLHERLELMRKY